MRHAAGGRQGYAVGGVEVRKTAIGGTGVPLPGTIADGALPNAIAVIAHAQLIMLIMMFITRSLVARRHSGTRALSLGSFACRCWSAPLWGVRLVLGDIAFGRHQAAGCGVGLTTCCGSPGSRRSSLRHQHRHHPVHGGKRFGGDGCGEWLFASPWRSSSKRPARDRQIGPTMPSADMITLIVATFMTPSIRRVARRWFGGQCGCAAAGLCRRSAATRETRQLSLSSRIGLRHRQLEPRRTTCRYGASAYVDAPQTHVLRGL